MPTYGGRYLWLALHLFRSRAASRSRWARTTAARGATLDAVVESAPPLPYEVRARLAWLLRGQHHRSRRDNAA